MMGEVLGIISDSHGRAEVTGSAVRLLEESGATRILHLGDVESEQVLDELVGHNAHVVFGNCDLDVRGLTQYAENVDVVVEHPIGWLKVDGKTVAFTHGHLEIAVEQAMRNHVDYLLLGHTHEIRDERLNGTRIINPGALFRARRYTAALLEPAADRLEILEIPRD